jgi:signal transduction histidine kinase
MVNKLSSFYKLIRTVLLRTIYFTIAFLLLEFSTISLVYHNEIKDLNNRVQQTVSAGGHDIYLICNYINCKNIIEENIHYVNTEIGIVVNEKNDTNSKILFAFFNSDLDSVIRHNNTLFIVNNDSKWNFINRLLALSTFILFIVIFIFSFKIRLDILKKESYARNSFKNDLESKLQRDLTESLHHEMGTPLAVIRTLLDEIIKTIYPCDVTESGICTLKVSNKKIPDCKECVHNYSKRALDSTISEYYEQISLALDNLFTLQTLIGKSKRISYSNGTVSLFEILNNVILSSNQLRIFILGIRCPWRP